MNRSKFNNRQITRWWLVGALLATATLSALAFFFGGRFSSHNEAAVVRSKQPLHIQTPSAVKGIYISACALAATTTRESLVAFVEQTELNAVVIDVKDSTGKLSFQTTDPRFADAVATSCVVDDLPQIIAELHKKSIYVIGRIATFQDPYYTRKFPEQAVQKKGGGVWKDYKGLSFIDVSSTEYWSYAAQLGALAYGLGVDELNYDYVRFPTDGNLSQMVFARSAGKPKAEALELFFQYVSSQLRPTGAVLSADLFGMVATNTDDLGIGQVLERALPYFDYISPMLYPSHYPSGYRGFADVDAHAYDIVHGALVTASARTESPTTTVASLAYGKAKNGVYTKPVVPRAALRPWLQSFDYPVHYTPEMVQAQIQAARDAGIDSYLFWDAANKYTALRAVLAP